MALHVGAMAPDFDLPVVIGEQKHRFRLSELRGKKSAVIAFWVLNWTPV